MMTEHVHDPANITNPEHGEHHVITPKTYAIVFATLLTLTATTVVAAFINLGIYNPVIALGIACTKAVVVTLFFMHVYFQSKLIRMTVAAGIFTFLILVTLSLSDYISRAWGLW
ncbi:MAG: cytochrome C oxidase subunit IV family protein [Acidobacteriaceae bacterium]|nr:cytochrome C oxidase subunit IV family protein [Acidobacteriaceae bacterium]